MIAKSTLLGIPFIILALGMFSCNTEETSFSLKSPDQSLEVRVELDDKGSPSYFVLSGEKAVLESSALGLQLEGIDLSTQLAIEKIEPTEEVKDQYQLLSGKCSSCSYSANKKAIRFAEKGGVQMTVVFQLSDDGLAFRYLLDGDSTTLVKVAAEQTTFNFSDATKAWLHPHAVAQSGWEHTQPSYEENYQVDIPVGTPAPLGQGWSFPALFHTPDYWVLVSETDMVRSYCGSHLGQQSPGGEYQIAFPQAPERMSPDAPLFPEGTLPLKSPWRTLVIGETLSPIVESSLSTDVSTPSKIDNADFVKPGKASWSWVLLKDDSTIYPVQKRFIDFAADMNWEYCLIDAYWDTQIGFDSIVALANYAKTKDVGIILWYNSNGSWNTAPLTPKNRVTDPNIRRAEFAKLQQTGIKGLKIDFFGGDGQSFMNYYQDLIEDAAKYDMVVNFHGATIPRGWHRTYPNLVTMESVKGFEFATFEQPNADAVPVHCTILPFTRNATAPMDFTPMSFSETPNLQRHTSNAYELALSVLFQSGVQHYAAVPTGMYQQPEYVVEFLRKLPSGWDEVRFLDGYPGKYVVLARRKADRWFIAGINGQQNSQNIRLDLATLGNIAGGQLISDGADNRSFSSNALEGPLLEISLNSNGGFVFEATTH